jgi:predicted trehalose synthase
VRRLIDDLLTAHLKSQLLKRQEIFFQQSGKRLLVYGGQIDDLREEIGVLQHQGQNKAEAWAAILDAIQSQAAISVMDANFARLNLGLEKLGPTLAAIHRLQNTELPTLPETSNTPVAQLQLPTEKLGDLLTAVLQQTSE